MSYPRTFCARRILKLYIKSNDLMMLQRNGHLNDTLGLKQVRLTCLIAMSVRTRMQIFTTDKRKKLTVNKIGGKKLVARLIKKR